MSTFYFRDIIDNFINDIEEDHELTRKVCRFVANHETYLFSGFKRIDPNHKGVRLTDIR